MTIPVRFYKSSDYSAVIKLYKQSALFGGQFDPDRDSEERLKSQIQSDPESILVAEYKKELVGTVSIIQDKRVTFLFRFCVVDNESKDEIGEALFEKAVKIL